MLRGGLRDRSESSRLAFQRLIKPRAEQKIQLQSALENALLEKANEELAPFIEGFAPLHPRAVSHAERYRGSTDDGFDNLVNGPFLINC